MKFKSAIYSVLKETAPEWKSHSFSEGAYFTNMKYGLTVWLILTPNQTRPRHLKRSGNPLSPGDVIIVSIKSGWDWTFNLTDPESIPNIKTKLTELTNQSS